MRQVSSASAVFLTPHRCSLDAPHAPEPQHGAFHRIAATAQESFHRQQLELQDGVVHAQELDQLLQIPVSEMARDVKFVVTPRKPVPDEEAALPQRSSDR